MIEVSGERNKLKALLSIFGCETLVELEFSPDQQTELDQAAAVSLRRAAFEVVSTRRIGPEVR